MRDMASLRENLKEKSITDSPMNVPPNPLPQKKLANIRNVRYTSHIRPKRAGIIIYTIDPKDGKRYFALGIDSTYGTLTDFGGGVSYRKDINAKFGAIREFHEESLLVFGQCTSRNIDDMVCIYNETNMIIFLRVYMTLPQREEVCTEFQNRLQKAPNAYEISEIVWLTQVDIRIAQEEKLIYEPVSNLLSLIDLGRLR